MLSSTVQGQGGAQVLNDKIGVIGAGKIGTAIARGIIQAGVAVKENVMASDVSDALRQGIANELGIKVTADNVELCTFADIVILAVKPQIVDPVAREISKKLGKAKLLVSVAARSEEHTSELQSRRD